MSRLILAFHKQYPAVWIEVWYRSLLHGARMAASERLLLSCRRGRTAQRSLFRRVGASSRLFAARHFFRPDRKRALPLPPLTCSIQDTAGYKPRHRRQQLGFHNDLLPARRSQKKNKLKGPGLTGIRRPAEQLRKRPCRRPTASRRAAPLDSFLPLALRTPTRSYTPNQTTLCQEGLLLPSVVHRRSSGKPGAT